MGAWAELVNVLYERFLLRDVFGKIIPGAVVLLGFGAAATGMRADALLEGVQSEPDITIALLVGLSWPAAFVAQTIREALTWAARRLRCRRVPWIDWNFVIVQRALAREGSRPRLSNFGAQELERLSTIKEATGNLGTALLVLVAGLLIGSTYEGKSLCVSDRYAPMAAALVAAVLLLSRHRRAALDEFNMQVDLGLDVETEDEMTKPSN